MGRGLFFYIKSLGGAYYHIIRKEPHYGEGHYMMGRDNIS